jgi:uncharacterized protein (DUF362 family)
MSRPEGGGRRPEDDRQGGSGRRQDPAPPPDHRDGGENRHREQPEHDGPRGPEKLVTLGEPYPSRSSVSRREFIRRVGTAGAVAVGTGALAVGIHNRDPDRAPAPIRLPDFRVEERPDLPSIVAAEGGSPQLMLQRCFERMGGIGRFIEPGDRVVLKPNIGFATPPALGATTNPEVVAVMTRLCLAQGATEVWVVDNPIHDPARCLAISGIEAAATSAGARIMLPRPAAFRDVEAPDNAILTRWPFFYAPFERATKVIGIPAAKHHSLSGVTLGMKNWYGLLGGRRNRLHQDIHTSVADLASLVRPTLTVLDATRVLFRHGPTGGSPSDVRFDGIVAVATDPVALDAYGASVVVPEGGDFPFLEEAERRGLGTTDIWSAGFEMISL